MKDSHWLHYHFESLVIITMIWLIVMEHLCQTLPGIFPITPHTYRILLHKPFLKVKVWNGRVNDYLPTFFFFYLFHIIHHTSSGCPLISQKCQYSLFSMLIVQLLFYLILSFSFFEILIKSTSKRLCSRLLVTENERFEIV